jgi:hypothetical protein
MLDLQTACPEDFDPALDQTFELVAEPNHWPLHLTRVERVGHGHALRRQPFTLRFTGAPALRIPQGIYRLEHAELGSLEIFLVQTGSDGAGSYFEAVFN